MEARALKDTRPHKGQHFAWREQLSLRLREGALLGMIALCLYLCMALFTYDVADDGWRHSSGMPVQNAGGSVGAYIADISVLVLGYLAYLFPVIVAIKVWQMFRRRHLPLIWNGWLFSWRLIGFVMTLLAGTALAALHGSTPAGFPEDGGAGGVLGQLLSELSKPALNMQGSTLLFLTLFLFGLTVFTNLSWFKVMDLIGRITLDLLDLFRRGWSSWRERRAAAREMAPVQAPAGRREPLISAEEKHQAEQARPRRQDTPAKPVAARDQRQPPRIEPLDTRPVQPTVRPRKEQPAPLKSGPVEPGSLPPIGLLDPASKLNKGFSPESLERCPACWS